ILLLIMLKDTKSLGNNKASAWESRGFVIKKEGMHFDTPSCTGDKQKGVSGQKGGDYKSGFTEND
ncbi:hypothetical protein QVN97_14755, partial [Bacteroides caecigallinarum]|nr:hypothetical protein [Bacteroides caecigallinarum]